jgi:hypothetical protein
VLSARFYSSVVDVNCKSIKKVEDTDYDSKEHCSSLWLTDCFKPIEYVKKSKVGGAFGNIKNEVRLSVYTTKEALKKPETRGLDQKSINRPHARNCYSRLFNRLWNS